MPAFRRYLLISNREERHTGENAQLDVASWNALANVANPADYDCWVLNVSALKEQQPPKLFTDGELKVLFHQSNFGPVLLGGGRIYIIGDLTTAFFTPPSKGSGAGLTNATPTATPPPPRSPYIPFAELLGLTRDSRPIDYRRVSRTHDYDYKKFYAFLDQVVRWDYSLRIKDKEKANRRNLQVGRNELRNMCSSVFLDWTRVDKYSPFARNDRRGRRESCSPTLSWF